MSLLRTALFTKLSTDVNLSALVASRIYPVKAPPNGVVPPYITYFKVSTNRVQSMQGNSQLSAVLMQFDCWAKTHQESDDLAEKLRLCIQGFLGTVSGVVIRGILNENQLEEYDDEAELYRVITEYRIWHEEA